MGFFSRSTRIGFLLMVLIVTPVPDTAFSITVKQEKELSKEFLKLIFSQVELIEEPFLNEYVNNLGQKILSGLPPQPFSYRFYVVKNDVYNAFATPAGHIFIYSGLIEAMETEEELAGILAHEIAHVVCRHISQNIERGKKLKLATLAGIIAGIFVGSRQSGEAGKAIMAGTMATGQTLALAYSRDDEMQADKLALDYLKKAGYKPDGLMTILYKIRGKHWFNDKIPSYLMTHPAVDDRIAYIDTWRNSPKNKKKNSVKPDRFNLIHTRLVARYGDESVALKEFQQAVKKKNPDVMAHYGYGMILDRIGKRKESIPHFKKALERKAFSPQILTDLGRAFLLQGRYDDSLNTLKSAISISPQNPETLFYFGRIHYELGDFKQAESALNQCIKITPGYKPAYYYLGKTLGKMGKLGEAHVNLGLFYYKKRKYKTARVQFVKALEKIEDRNKREKIEKILKSINHIIRKQRMEKMGKKRQGMAPGLGISGRPLI